VPLHARKRDHAHDKDEREQQPGDRVYRHGGYSAGAAGA